MTGFVILALVVAAISIALEVSHRRHADPTAGGPTAGSWPVRDADRRRIVAELEAVAQRTGRTGPVGRRWRQPADQDAVNVLTKASSSV